MGVPLERSRGGPEKSRGRRGTSQIVLGKHREGSRRAKQKERGASWGSTGGRGAGRMPGGSGGRAKTRRNEEDGGQRARKGKVPPMWQHP